jgi:hypothetical protein
VENELDKATRREDAVASSRSGNAVQLVLNAADAPSTCAHDVVIALYLDERSDSMIMVEHIRVQI